MGLFDFLFGSGSSSSGSRDEVRIEGRQSKRHQHNDGTWGRDIYAAEVSCRDGEKVSERNAGWGHVSVGDDGSKSDHLK